MTASRIALCLCITLVATSFVSPSFSKAPRSFNAEADVGSITALEKSLAPQTELSVIKRAYAPDAVVFDAAAPGTYTSSAQLLAALAAQLAPVKSIAASIDGIQVISDGKLACAAFMPRFNVQLKTGGTVNLALRQLDALQKVNGKWEIIGSHLSYAADPQTGRSILDPPAAPMPRLAISGNPFAGPAPPPDRADAALRAWTLRYALALNEQMQIATMGPGDETMAFDGYSPNPVNGRNALISYYTPLFAPMAGITGHFTYFHSQSDGTFGLEMSVQHLDVVLKNGRRWPLFIRQSDCLHYVDGQWYSMIDMNSYPTIMTTGMAVMNYK
jgi:ketosteroid isomerase-like protein